MMDDERTVRTKVWRKVSLIFATQVFLSTAVGLNLTIVALTAVEVTGRRNLGGLAQTTMIFGATIITLVATRISVRKDRLFSLRCTIIMAVFGSVLCCFSTADPSRFGAFVFIGFFLLGGGSVSALISRFAAAEKVGAEGPTAHAIGLVLFGSACGSAIGPNIYSLVHKLTNSLLPVTFLFSALIFVLSLIPLGFEKRKNYVPLLRDLGTDAKLVWCPQFTAVFLVAVVAHSMMIGLMTMAPIHTDEVFGVSGSSLVMTAHLLGMYAFSPLVGIVSTRLGFVNTVFLGVAIMLLSVVLLAFFHGTFVLFVLGLFGVGLAWSIGLIASSAAVSQVPDSVQRMKVQGRLDVCINVAAGVTSLCSGLVTGAVGYPALATGFLAVLATISIIALFYQYAYSYQDRV